MRSTVGASGTDPEAASGRHAGTAGSMASVLPGPARLVAAFIALALVAGCSNDGPTSAPSNGAATPAATAAGANPTASPAPTPTPPATFPLAVVTGLTNNKATVTMDELEGLAKAGKLTMPCGVSSPELKVHNSADCVPADGIATAIEADQEMVALLPAGLVEPATKILPFAGDGPFGLFGADLFGDPEARALPYPLTGSATGDPALDPAWIAYDPAITWTLTETGSLCADRGAARQAVTNGKGWDWVFDGGTAKYNGKPIPNPNPPPGIDRHLIVRPVETGNDGVTAKLISRADVTLGNLKCPVLPTKDWKPANQALGLSVPEAVLDRWESFLGIDAVYLPADHQSDRGVRGIRSTLTLLDKHGFPHTGLGMDLDEALEPAYVEVAGQKVAFVAWNNVPGPVHAAADTPGVAWLTKSNVHAAVKRAQGAGADVIVCDPQWWAPGSEYRETLYPNQQRAVGWMDAAGCDQILGGGLHISGAVYLRRTSDGVRAINVGPGNFQYGQDFWQKTQEGVVVELAFRGATLVNIRLHPYVMILAARAALLDPEGDGNYVLDRVWSYSELDDRT
jgi:hypothetical protein